MLTCLKKINITMNNSLLKELEKFSPTASDLISIEDLKKSEIENIFNLVEKTENLLKGEMKKTFLLKGKTQLNFFMENSTRTRTSFELAGKNLGADTINISASASSMSKGESLLDTAVTLDSMQPDIIVMRTPSSGAVKYFAKNVHAAVINAGDGCNEHPSQALLDLYTMQKFHGKNLKGKKLVIVGDILHSRVFGSLARAAKLFGLNTIVTTPHTLIRPDLSYFNVTHEPNIEKALKDADIIYSLRLQTERASLSYVPSIREYSKTYIINAARLKFANPNAIVMHAGPVIREVDIHTNVLETEHSLVPHQVFSGYCIRFVLLNLFANKRKLKKVDSRPF
ncbi:aspartate carbamoyltransferase catalytic subunit [Candidatus Peregrinibacteria bacterium]|nr:aspartate carbamoyltransferase catalytic subunit [Candidatus Peregrinibacteria bacterium]